jgi:S1-C subfamily serine protease
MKPTLVLFACFVLAGASSTTADVMDDQNSLRDATTLHHELRDAVARIRSYYSPDDAAIAPLRLAGVDRQTRLGIVLGAGLPGLGGEEEVGALIVAVTPGSPADEAGLMAGDVITAFNGKALLDEAADRRAVTVAAARRLAEMSRDLEDGDKVILDYVRDGSSHRVEMVVREFEFYPMIVGRLRESDSDDVYSFAFSHPHVVAGTWFLPSGWLDMELVALNPELGEYFGAERGVLVVRAPKDDDTLGLQSGDVILSIDGREVRSPEHAMRILRSYEPEEALSLHIVRHQRSQTLSVTVPQRPIDFDFSWMLEPKPSRIPE